MAEKKYILTKEEREQLEKEYRDLLDVQRPDIIQKLALARSQGDLSENADYDAARDRQSQIEGRINEIEAIFNNSVSAEEASSGKKGSHISIGDIVTYLDKVEDEEVTVKIVGNIGADPMAKPYPTVSNESPIGRALLGQTEGKIVTVDSNEPYEIEIVKIAR